MRYSSVLIVAAITVCESVAGPTHAHLHRHARAHAKKDVVNWDSLDWEKMDIDWTAAWAAGQKTAAPSATVVEVEPTVVPTVAPIIAAQKIKATTTAVEAPASTSEAPKAASSSAAADVLSDVTTAFSSIVGLANKLTSFGTPTEGSGSIIDKIGNIGNPQGSNMIKVDSVGDHKYTNTFENTSGKSMTIMVWNKAYAENNDMNNIKANLGAMKAPTSPALSITLAPGESQVVAFQEDTQAGWAQATTDIHISGSYATTWAEINYISTGCGYDVSAIMNKHGNTYDMEMTALETPCVSNMVNNLWIARNGNPEDPIPIGDSDGSCFIPAGKCTVHTKMGGQQ